MAARPDVGGVVHDHSPHATALAASGHPLLPVSYAANYFGPTGVPRFTETADLIVTPGLGKAVAAQLGSAFALFLVNHGIVTVGPDLPVATVAAVVLERACQQQLLTRSHGGWATWSDAEESRAKQRHVYSEHSVYSVWEYLVRRVTTSTTRAS